MSCVRGVLSSSVSPSLTSGGAICGLNDAMSSRVQVRPPYSFLPFPLPVLFSSSSRGLPLLRPGTPCTETKHRLRSPATRGERWSRSGPVRWRGDPVVGVLNPILFQKTGAIIPRSELPRDLTRLQTCGCDIYLRFTGIHAPKMEELDDLTNLELALGGANVCSRD
ncbi:hypothetical protein AAG570_001987 [Ranatra chinensis]|uniref:Uncharacterized protein n=1 Tax=Ranatra chinensis TaxID=642074 RepID=A0ABD0YAC9_9HEMI